MKTSVIIIGTGPVGIRAVEEISTQQPDTSISLYGEEPCEPYNRVLLSNYLAGQDDFEKIKLSPAIHEKTQLKTHYNCAITAIDPVKKLVHRADGESENYDKLILATGSHAHIPNIENTSLSGIFTLRTIQDADTLIQRKSKTTVVLGGGLLGLETARALHSQGNGEVIVIDHSLSLMSRQLNKEAGDILAEKVQNMGLKVILGNGIKHINGEEEITSIELRSGMVIPCDTLVFAIGIRPNIELAKSSGILTRHGIVVDNHLQTSATDIYAVGECAEHMHLTYGIVAPGFEQARIMASNITGKKQIYQGSILSTRLKVLIFPVFSMGRVGENESGLPDDRISYQDDATEVYRQLVVFRGRIIGCIALGDWTELSRINTAIEKNKRIWPWEIKRFKETGLIWAEKSADSVIYWPDNEIVCNCNQVTRGQLATAINNGCQTVCTLSEKTLAGTTCGSCTSLLSELLGSKIAAVKAFKTLAAFSVLALIASCFIIFYPEIAYQQQATVEWFYDQLWRDNFLKLVSGYTLLGCSVVVLTLSLRKRVDKFSKGDFAWWRIMHVIVGFITLLTLIAHTGFRLGNNLNLYLMISFSGLLLVGAIAGLVIASEHKLNPGTARKLRSQFIWVHILFFWPLPALLGFHIMQTYYF